MYISVDYNDRLFAAPYGSIADHTLSARTYYTDSSFLKVMTDQIVVWIVRPHAGIAHMLLLYSGLAQARPELYGMINTSLH